MVSACLLGKNCTYTGGNNKNDKLISVLKHKNLFSLCPEELGGLPIPRPPAEIVGGDGADVLRGQAQIKTRDGTDVTGSFLKGAGEVKKMISDQPVTLAIMKERSPSCGVCRIYDGTFSDNTVSGSGVCTAQLQKLGIKVISEETPLTGEILRLIEEDRF